MKGKTPNKSEKKWMSGICSLGCIVCYNEHGVYSPASPHHIDGKTKEGAHFKTIPLCHAHHQLDDSNPAYESVHGNKARFEKAYGKELELLEQIKAIINNQGL